MKITQLATILSFASLGTAHAQVDKGGFVSRPYLVFESNGRPGKSTKSSPSITGKSGKSDITSSTKGKSSKCFTSASPDRVAEIAGINDLSMSSMMLVESYSMSSLSFDASAAIHGAREANLIPKVVARVPRARQTKAKIMESIHVVFQTVIQPLLLPL